jgi:ABC-2 type transport system permease protein
MIAQALLVASKEWLVWRRDRLLAIMMLAIAGLALISAAVSIQDSQALQAERRLAQLHTYDQWKGQGAKNPHSASHFGQYGFKEPGVLASFDPGITAFTGATVWMEAHKQNDARYRPARDGTTLERLGALNPAFVLQVFAPLLIIGLMFNSVSSERERGIVTVGLLSGLDARTALLGKLLASGVLITLLSLVPVVIAAFASVSDADHSGVAGDVVLRAALMGLAYFLYLAGFAGLCVGVSAWTQSSRTSLVLLLSVWLASCFVLPRATTDIAAKAFRTPSAVEFHRDLALARSASSAHDATHPAYQALLSRALLRFDKSRIEELPFDFDGLALKADDAFGYQVFDQAYGALWKQHLKQETLKTLIGVVAPMSAIQQTSMALAGTDLTAHLQFMRQAERYRRTIQTLTSDDLMLNRRYGDRSYTAGPELWAKMPPFHPEPLTLSQPGDLRSATTLGLGVLALWSGLGLGFAWWTARQ